MQKRLEIHGEAKMANPFSQLDLERSVVDDWENKFGIYRIAERKSIDIVTVIEILVIRVFLTHKGRPHTPENSDLSPLTLCTSQALAILIRIGRSTLDELKIRNGITCPRKMELGQDQTIGRKIEILMKLLQGVSQSAIAALYECGRQPINVIALDALDAGFKITLQRNASRKPQGHNLLMRALYMLSIGKDDTDIALTLNVCALKVANLRSIAIEKGFLGE